MQQDQKSKHGPLWWIVVMAICYVGVKYSAETIARYMATQHLNHQAAREEKQIAPASEKEYRAVLETLDSNLASKQAEILEWYQLNVSSPNGDIRTKLLPDTASSFRGLNFKMTVDQVKAHENNQIDTILSPAPPVRPMANLLTYWYYIADGAVGILNYHFDSAGRLNDIALTFIEEPVPEADFLPYLNSVVALFSSALGAPKKHSDYAYEWSTPALRAYIFGMPESKSSQLLIAYARQQDSLQKMDVNKKREELIEMYRMSQEAFEKALSGE